MRPIKKYRYVTITREILFRYVCAIPVPFYDANNPDGRSKKQQHATELLITMGPLEYTSSLFTCPKFAMTPPP